MDQRANRFPVGKIDRSAADSSLNGVHQMACRNRKDRPFQLGSMSVPVPALDRYRTTPEMNPALRRGGLISFFRKQCAAFPAYPGRA